MIFIEALPWFFQVRFKPLPLPSREPDSTEPVFGRFDMTNEKMADKRQRAHSLYRDQLAIVDQRKRDAILKRLSEQNEEEEMLARTKREWVLTCSATKKGWKYSQKSFS